MKGKDGIEYTTVTIRVPVTMYSEYKAVLAQRGAIVTYDLRRHMMGVIDASKSEVERANQEQ